MEQCGDGVCDQPFEFAQFAHLGCQVALHRVLTVLCSSGALAAQALALLNVQADCGLERDLFPVVLVLKGDFSTTLLGQGAAVDLAAAVRWNLCRVDAAREASELDPLCWCVLLSFGHFGAWPVTAHFGAWPVTCITHVPRDAYQVRG